MDSMMSALRGIKRWQVAVLVVLLAVVVGGVYGGYALATRGSDTGLGENEQAVPVQYGTLTNDISINGSLVYPDKESLTFAASGTVGEVLVEEGQEIKEGDVLATLDTATRAILEKAVSDASFALQDAQEVLAEAGTPSDLEVAKAEASVSNAKLSLQNAQDALDSVQVGPSDKDVTKAQSAVDSANASLKYAEQDLETAQEDWAANIEAAQDTVASDSEAYGTVFQKWLGVDLTEEEATLDPESVLSAMGADLTALFDPSLRFENFADSWTAPVPTDDPATRWNELTVYAWLNYYFGSIVPTCDGQTLDNRTVCVQKEMDDAWDTLQASIDNENVVEVQAEKAIASAESAVSAAQDKVDSAQEALSDLMAGPDPLEVDVKASQVKVAQATLADAESALADLLNGPDELELSVRESDVSAAQTALDSAREKLDGATLVSPMDGVVMTLNVESGDAVDVKTAVMVIADPSVIEISGTVDEIDVLFVKKGAEATVTMDALSGQALTGVVSDVSSEAMTQSGVVSYPISITVNLPDDVQLVEGLSAVATVVLSQEDGLLIPLQSVFGTYQQPTVQVVTDHGVETRDVSLGNSDDFWTVVQSGLSEGEKVVMEVTSSSDASTFQFRSSQMGGFDIGGMSGGFPVGGGGRTIINGR